MLKRHSDQLDNRLDDVASFGWAHIKWRELYRWYDTQKISKNVWRDLKSRLSDIDVNEIFILQDGTGILIHTKPGDDYFDIRDKTGQSEDV